MNAVEIATVTRHWVPAYFVDGVQKNWRYKISCPWHSTTFSLSYATKAEAVAAMREEHADCEERWNAR